MRKNNKSKQHLSHYYKLFMLNYHRYVLTAQCRDSGWIMGGSSQTGTGNTTRNLMQLQSKSTHVTATHSCGSKRAKLLSVEMPETCKKTSTASFYSLPRTPGARAEKQMTHNILLFCPNYQTILLLHIRSIKSIHLVSRANLIFLDCLL